MNLLSWLNTNSGALQSIAAIMAIFLTVVTIKVLTVTWHSIRDQAKAARAFTAVAVDQTQVGSK